MAGALSTPPTQHDGEPLEEGFTEATKMNVVREDIVYDPGSGIPEIPLHLFKAALLHRVDEHLVTLVCEKLKAQNILSDEGWTEMEYDKLKQSKKENGGSGNGVVSQVGNVAASAENASVGTQDTQAAASSSGKPKPKQDATDPKSKIDEPSFFGPLANISNKTLAILQELKGEKRKVRFLNSPNRSLRSEGSHGQYKSDMAVLLEETRSVSLPKGKARNKGKDKGKKNEARSEREQEQEQEQEQHECDIVLAAECKLKISERDIDDNISKVLGNLNHIMSADLSRRFVYGLTVEHSNVRLWFCSRSHIFVTEIFDLQNDARELVYLMLALGIASNEALGFDPTVKMVVSSTGKGVTYRFTIDNEEYEVIEAISTYKAKFLLGRANRVLKVRRVLPSGDLDSVIKVVKDVWIPQDAKTELDMRQHIQKNLGRNPVQGLDRSTFDNHFVKIEKCELVQVPSMSDPKVIVDDNSTNFLRGLEVPKSSRFILKRTTTEYKKCIVSPISNSLITSLQDTPGTFRADTMELKKMGREHYGCRAHCRLLMEYAGIPLSKVRNLRVVVLCVVQVITALTFMYSAGVVHRDISPGNILVAETSEGVTAKLCDLECAKDLMSATSSKSKDVKTGTPFFMAVEVEAGDLLFDPNDILDEDEDEKSRQFPFHHRYLHDLESLFWILVYFLFATHPSEPEEEMDEQLNDGRLANFQTLFPYPTGKVQDTVVRAGFLKGDRAIRARVTSFLPEQLREALVNFYYIARDLRQEYQRVETNPMKLRAEDPLKLYKSTMTHLDTLLNSPEKPAWLGDVISLSRNASAGTKRKAATVTDDSARKKGRHI